MHKFDQKLWIQTVASCLKESENLFPIVESVRNYNLCMRVEETVACNCAPMLNADVIKKRAHDNKFTMDKL